MSQEFPPRQKPYTRNCEILEPGVFPSGMQRLALGIEYDGAGLRGFQRQSNTVETVQQYLEVALSRVADEPLTVVCAGRTDAGVHATGQVVHFDTLAQRPDKAWTRGVNALLPDSIAVRWATPVSETFHSRFSATHRTYRYLICNTRYRPALGCEQLTWLRESLDIDAMWTASRCLEGEHDFSSFRSSQCQARSPRRRIHYLHIARCGDLIVMEVRANAFLHHMVRNLAGVLLAVGKGERPVDWVRRVLDARDRRAGGVTASPKGLYLVDVGYPERFPLPWMAAGPMYCSAPLGGYSDPHND